MTIGGADPSGARTMKASEFKAKCLKLMDEVAQTGGEIIITKNGKPVSRLTPYREKADAFIGRDRGKIEILGDIIEPIDVAWEAEQGLIDDKPASSRIPYREEPETWFGRNRGKIEILGDIVSPMPAEWFADPAEKDNLF